jgi:hypothetical protein
MTRVRVPHQIRAQIVRSDRFEILIERRQKSQLTFTESHSLRQCQLSWWLPLVLGVA